MSGWRISALIRCRVKFHMEAKPRSGREIMDDPASVAWELHKKLYYDLQPSYFIPPTEQ